MCADSCRETVVHVIQSSSLDESVFLPAILIAFNLRVGSASLDELRYVSFARLQNKPVM